MPISEKRRYKGYCRTWDRHCTYCLRSRTLYTAPSIDTFDSTFDIIYLKYQPRKHEKIKVGHFSWKRKFKVKRQYLKG
jgi:hypothetical protein